MPYIKKLDRQRLSVEALEYGAMQPKTAGELNYALTRLAYSYFTNHGRDYQRINDVVGALEGAKLEFYRRVAAPYEDTKIKENGDVY